MGLGNTLSILRPPERSTPPIQTGWNEDLVKNMHNVLGEMAQQITARIFGGLPEGTSRPASVKANVFWLDITTATDPVVKLFDGTDDITVMTFDYGANTVTFAGVSFDLVDDTSPQLGGNLDLNGNVITGLEIGTDVQAFDATLTSLAAVAGVAGDVLFASGTDTWARLAKDTDGQVLTLASGIPSWVTPAASETVVVKTADETVNNSTTLQDDNDLVFALAANTTYAVDLVLLLSVTSNTPDFKIGWTVPSGCTMFWEELAAGAWGANSSPSDLKTESETDTAFTVEFDNGGSWRAIVRNGANAGNLQLRWAQNTAHESDSKVLKHSHMIIRSLGAT